MSEVHQYRGTPLWSGKHTVRPGIMPVEEAESNIRHIQDRMNITMTMSLWLITPARKDSK